MWYREIECLKRVELLKQQLVSKFDYSILSIFRLIDKYAHGKINSDNLRVFLSAHDCAAEIEHTDIVNWIRRFDKDVDGGLKFVDLVNALQTMTNYQPKTVQMANDITRHENEAREQQEIMANSHIDSGSNLMQSGERISSGGFMNNQMIQIEDMGGVTNVTQHHNLSQINERKAHSNLISESQSMVGIGGKSGDPSRLGHATRTTEYTSNIGMNTTNEHGHGGGFDRAVSAAGTIGGQMSMGFQPTGSVTPNAAGADNILNYPYSYDQDQKHEVDFAERLYRANHEV